jgi:hypothetical protein
MTTTATPLTADRKICAPDVVLAASVGAAKTTIGARAAPDPPPRSLHTPTNEEAAPRVGDERR